jgi:CheY-like chemotaxis protein
MAKTKRILVVDDHFEMLESLRSILEISNQEYKVLAVPSAEEGFYEMRRRPFDLLITDLRLPGMNGFELIRKVKTSYPATPVIMITGYSSDQGREEAEALGVFRYFQKPLDTEGLLAAVEAALYGQSASKPAITTPTPAPGNMPIPAEIPRRLEMLRADTGARYLMLTDQVGKILFETGNSGQLALTTIAEVMATNLHDSFALSKLLGSEQPVNIQFQAGQQVDLYYANVGWQYLLALFFNAESRRGRIGTVWVFAQRAIKDLLELTGAANIAAQDKAAVSAGADTAVADTAVADTAVADTAATDIAVAETAESAGAVANTAAAPADSTEGASLAVDTAAEAPVNESVSISPLAASEIDESEASFDFDDDNIRALLELDLAPTPDNVDLDAFWEQALAAESGPSSMEGVSLEEAVRQGLVSFEDQETDES